MKRVVAFIDFTSFVIVLGLFYLLIDREQKSTGLVVLADNGKVQNAVLIAVGEDEVSLDVVGEMASFKEGEKPSEVTMMSKEEMDKKFGNVLKAEAPKAERFFLYLNKESSDLDEPSKEKIKLIIEMIEARSPCMVDIIGHTDTTGSASMNIEYSLKRAGVVKELLKKEGVTVSDFLVKGYGEENLLIPTADNVKELQNRNVEIFIK